MYDGINGPIDKTVSVTAPSAYGGVNRQVNAMMAPIRPSISPTAALDKPKKTVTHASYLVGGTQQRKLLI